MSSGLVPQDYLPAKLHQLALVLEQEPVDPRHREIIWQQFPNLLQLHRERRHGHFASAHRSGAAHEPHRPDDQRIDAVVVQEHFRAIEVLQVRQRHEHLLSRIRLGGTRRHAPFCERLTQGRRARVRGLQQHRHQNQHAREEGNDSAGHDESPFHKDLGALCCAPMERLSDRRGSFEGGCDRAIAAWIDGGATTGRERNHSGGRTNP